MSLSNPGLSMTHTIYRKLPKSIDLCILCPGKSFWPPFGILFLDLGSDWRLNGLLVIIFIYLFCSNMSFVHLTDWDPKNGTFQSYIGHRDPDSNAYHECIASLPSNLMES